MRVKSTSIPSVPTYFYRFPSTLLWEEGESCKDCIASQSHRFHHRVSWFPLLPTPTYQHNSVCVLHLAVQDPRNWQYPVSHLSLNLSKLPEWELDIQIVETVLTSSLRSLAPSHTLVHLSGLATVSPYLITSKVFSISSSVVSICSLPPNLEHKSSLNPPSNHLLLKRTTGSSSFRLLFISIK